MNSGGGDDTGCFKIKVGTQSTYSDVSEYENIEIWTEQILGQGK